MKPNITFALELKALNSGQFEGHGSTFGNVDLGGDVVLPGAFKTSLAEHKDAGTLPQMFWMHQPDMVPGKWLDMSEDDEGLYVKGELAPTQLGGEMKTLLKMNAVRGLSIGYRVRDYTYNKDGDRLLKEIDLWEVSLVSLAMNPLAQVEAMKTRLSREGEYVPTEREMEAALRDAGFSRNVARKMVSKLFDEEHSGTLFVPQRDAGTIDEVNDAELKAIASALASFPQL